MRTNSVVRIFLAAIALVAPSLCQALTLQQVLQRLGQEVLRPSESSDEITAYVLPAPLSSGVITPVIGATPTVNVASLSGNPQWFAFVDLFPCQLFQHDVKYVFVDDVTGVVTVFDADDWPALDGEQIGTVTPVGRLIPVFPLLPRPELFETAPNPAAPVGDYGDAPEDGAAAYPGVEGRFPTRFATTNSVLNRPGGHVTVTGLEMLGRTVSAERDAADPADPDGPPNLVDADSDERMFLALNPNTSPATAHLIFDVTAAIATPDVTRYVNVLCDFNRDGRWSSSAAGAEWAVTNLSVIAAPGSTNTFASPAFSWGTGSITPRLVWMRVALTRDTIDAMLFGAAGWDGSGALGAGEIEDARAYLKGCPGNGVPPPPDDDDGGEPPPETPPPGPPFGWNLLPVKFHALVVQGADNDDQKAAAQAAATMANTFQVQGYSTTSLSGANATAQKIEDWINGLLPGLSCQDHVLIYFIAHGAKNTPGGSMRLRPKSGGDPGTLTGAELADILALIPPCRDEDCDDAGKSCSVTVIIESCYSGQFVGALSGDGREIITTSSGTEPSWFGADGTGGEYSDQYANCANSSNSGQTDGNGDGFVTQNELHQWATANLGRPQTPQISSSLCPCECPWFWWDCLLDPDGFGVRYFPADITTDGEIVGTAFAGAVEGLVLAPGVPAYDFVKVPTPPNDWHWVAHIPTPAGPPFQLDVTAIGVSNAVPIRVQLFTLNVPPTQFPPMPLQLRINLMQGFYILLDGMNQPLGQGPWNTYPQSLDPFLFQPIPAERSNGAPASQIQTEIIAMSLTSTTPILVRWTPRPNTVYFLEKKPRLDEAWETVAGPLDGRAHAIPVDSEEGYFRVRGAPAMPFTP